MIAYIIRRLLYMIPIILGVALLIFSLFTFFGDDPVRVALGQHASPEAIANLRHLWGLDRSLPAQFLDFLRQIVTFDYGVSFSTGRKLSEMFKEGALVSLSLTAPPFLCGIFISVSISLVLAYFRDSIADHLARIIIIMSMSISYLVYIITLQYVLAYHLDLFPISGYEPGMESIPYLFLPWLIIIIVTLGPDTRIYRTLFLEETSADYVRTARAKGAGEARVLFKHVLKNALIPIITYTVVAIPFLILGAFLMERFFSIPGVGDMIITAINEGDFPVLKGMTMIIAIMYSLFNLLTDVLYSFVDPRVKLS